MSFEKNVRISAVLITLNEEANIRRALNSLSWVDEVIVLDSGSIDHTVSICNEMGARVETHEWQGYVEAKNKVSSLADGEWILSLDADEEVTQALRAEIKNIVESPDSADGYQIPRRNHYLKKWIRHCGWYPDLQLRLWRKGKGEWTGGSVHESVRVTGRVEQTKGALNHYTYSSIAQHLDRMNKYAGLAARDKFAAGKRAGLFSLIFTPPWQFFRLYFLRLGILDGLHGLLVSSLGAFYAFLKKARLWELQQRIKKEQK